MSEEQKQAAAEALRCAVCVGAPIFRRRYRPSPTATTGYVPVLRSPIPAHQNNAPSTPSSGTTSGTDERADPAARRAILRGCTAPSSARELVDPLQRQCRNRLRGLVFLSRPRRRPRTCVLQQHGCR